MNAEALRAKWPTFKIKQDPDPACTKCNGIGERTLRGGESVPCWCVVTSHADAPLMQEVAGRVAQKMKQDFPWLGTERKN